MNKLIALMLICCISLSLFAQQGNSVYEKFMEYQKAPSMENFISAIEHYDSIKTDAENFTGYLLLANLYLTEFEKNLEIMSANLDSLSLGEKFQFANLLLAAGRHEQSIEIYNDLNVNSPKWSCPWRHKGEALLEMKNYEAAEISTLKAIETREDHFDAYVQLARIQKEMGEYEKALQSLQNGLKYQSTDTEGEIEDEEIILLLNELNRLIDK